MKKTFLRGVALTVLATGTAMAADLPARGRAPVVPAPVVYEYNWSGFYLGAHAGGGFGGRDCFSFLGAADGCHDTSGWLAGGQLGYNWQAGALVFGVEVSGSFADLNGSHPAVLAPADTYRSRVDGLGLLTGRLGWAFDRTLLYVTGGGAWANDQFRYAAAGIGTASANTDRWGWTVGAGAEFAITPNWSLGVQYNYVDLGNRNVTFSGGGVGTFTDSVNQQMHLATVRFNYRFGGSSVVARY